MLAVHRVSRQAVKLTVVEITPLEIVVSWPLAGHYRFHWDGRPISKEVQQWVLVTGDRTIEQALANAEAGGTHARILRKRRRKEEGKQLSLPDSKRGKPDE